MSVSKWGDNHLLLGEMQEPRAVWSQIRDLVRQAPLTTANTASFPCSTQTERDSTTSTFSRKSEKTLFHHLWENTAIPSEPSVIMILHIPRARWVEWDACVCNGKQMCVFRICVEPAETELHTHASHWAVPHHEMWHRISLADDGDIRNRIILVSDTSRDPPLYKWLLRVTWRLVFQWTWSTARLMERKTTEAQEDITQVTAGVGRTL